MSPGCAHCYAETFAERFRGVPGRPYEQGFDLRLVPEKLAEPLRWSQPRMVFVNSMSDLSAADEKNREGNSLQLRADLAAEIRDWLSDKAAAFQDAASNAPTVPFGAEVIQTAKVRYKSFWSRESAILSGLDSITRHTPVFDVPAGLLRTMNRDLRAAGIPKRDERGRTVDVHAMRTTFGSLLSKVGVYPRTAQAAMRHSDINLTMNVYTDPKLLDIQGAINALPDLPLDGGQSQTVTATGTDGGGGACTNACTGAWTNG